jgi:hypothetical protein
MILFLMENSLANDLLASCDEEYENCKTSCIQSYSAPKYDVWDRPRRESDTTRALRDKCRNLCLIGHKQCIRRAQKREDEEKKQEKLENQVQSKLGYSKPSSPSLPSDSKIYKWTDKNGVIHFTNNNASIPNEYPEQVEQGSNNETEAISNKNKTKPKNIDIKIE